MSKSFDAEIIRLTTIAREILEHDGGCHDWDHTQRVWHTAMHLAETECADRSVLAAAAILHDIARPQETADHGMTDHALLGSQMAMAILKRENIGDEKFRIHVAACIRTHRFRARSDEMPATLEARILYDADKLDALGAIGLARSFHFAGHSGARVHNTEEEALAGQPYGRDDTAYREYLVKLKSLPQKMLTDSGRQEGERRALFMQQFFAEMTREIQCNAHL